MLPDGYNYLPDCVWNCPRGGARALEEARRHADSNLGNKFPKLPNDINRFGEAFHLRFRSGSQIPREIRAAGSEECPSCWIKILCSSYVTEHFDTRQQNRDGSTDTHWGQGDTIEHDYFTEDGKLPKCG